MSDDNTWLSSQYRRDEESPAELDAAILREARAAVRPKRGRLPGLAAAASIVLAAALVWLLPPMDEPAAPHESAPMNDLPMRVDADANGRTPMAAMPAPAPVAIEEGAVVSAIDSIAVSGAEMAAPAPAPTAVLPGDGARKLLPGHRPETVGAPVKASAAARTSDASRSEDTVALSRTSQASASATTGRVFAEQSMADEGRDVVISEERLQARQEFALEAPADPAGQGEPQAGETGTARAARSLPSSEMASRTAAQTDLAQAADDRNPCPEPGAASVEVCRTNTGYAVRIGADVRGDCPEWLPLTHDEADVVALADDGTLLTGDGTRYTCLHTAWIGVAID